VLLAQTHNPAAARHRGLAHRPTAEASLVPEVGVVAAPTLSGLIDWLRDGDAIVLGSGVQVVDSGAGLAASAPDGASMG
jgi:hypothetical protein